MVVVQMKVEEAVVVQVVQEEIDLLVGMVVLEEQA
jgi:hypothetical protein